MAKLLWPKEEWFEAWFEKLQTDLTFTEGMKKFEGNISIGVKAEPKVGLDKDMYITFDASGGTIKGFGYCGKSDAERAKMCLLMDYSMGKEVCLGKVTSLMKLITSRKAKLTGSMVYTMKFMKPVTAMLSILGSIDTMFPDELSGDELENFKAWIKEIEAKAGV